MWKSLSCVVCFIPAVPTFVEKPDNEVKAEEEDVTFTCRAGGKPKPTVEWSINGELIQSKCTGIFIYLTSSNNTKS